MPDSFGSFQTTRTPDRIQSHHSTRHASAPLFELAWRILFLLVTESCVEFRIGSAGHVTILVQCVNDQDDQTI